MKYDRNRSDGVECPHCAYVDEDDLGERCCDVDEREESEQCGNCGRWYSVRTIVTWEWETASLVDDVEGLSEQQLPVLEALRRDSGWMHLENVRLVAGLVTLTETEQALRQLEARGLAKQQDVSGPGPVWNRTP